MKKKGQTNGRKIETVSPGWYMGVRTRGTCQRVVLTWHCYVNADVLSLYVCIQFICSFAIHCANTFFPRMVSVILKVSKVYKDRKVTPVQCETKYSLDERRFDKQMKILLRGHATRPSKLRNKSLFFERIDTQKGRMHYRAEINSPVKSQP